MACQLGYRLHEVKSLYYLQPGMTLHNGLRLVYDDDDVSEMITHVKKLGEISIYVEVGTPRDVPPRDVIFKSIDSSDADIAVVKAQCDKFRQDINEGENDRNVESEDADIEKGNADDNVLCDDENDNQLRIVNIEWESDEDDDELAVARWMVKQYKEDRERLRVEMEELSGENEEQNNAAGRSQTEHGDYIDSSDPGSYISTSDGSDADDVQRVRSSGLYYNPNVGIQEFSLGQIFRDSTQFKAALRDYSMQKQFAYRYKKNEKLRVRAKCAAQGCEWEILASRHGNDNSFRVKTFYGDHSCLLTTKNKGGCSSKVIADKFKDDITKMPGRRMKCSICHQHGHNRTRCPMFSDAHSSIAPRVPVS